MDRFTECLRFILEREGGYCDRPSDRGGATNKGVTQRVYDEYRTSQGLPLQPVKFILPDEVAAIYRDRYWLAARCNRLPVPLDLVVLDGAVNHGVHQSAKFLQRALGVEDDGLIGTVTITKAHEAEDAGQMDGVIASILAQREKFYDKLCEKDSSQLCHRKGWGNRLKELKLACEK